MPNPLILIVEDEYDIRALLVAYLEERGYRLATANDEDVGLDVLRATRPDLLIANVVLRGGDGERLAGLARAMDVPVLLISGEPAAIERLRGGSIPFLQKPFRLVDVERQIERLLAGKQKGLA